MQLFISYIILSIATLLMFYAGIKVTALQVRHWSLGVEERQAIPANLRLPAFLGLLLLPIGIALRFGTPTAFLPAIVLIGILLHHELTTHHLANNK